MPITMSDIRGRDEDKKPGITMNDIRGRQTINPSGSPLPMMENISRDPGRMPSAASLAISSLPTGEDDRVRYLAKQIFPNSRFEDVSDRFFYDPNNRLAYKDNEGRAQYIDPTLRLPTSLGNIQEIGKAIASGAGPAMPMLGGTGMGLMSMGFGGGVPGAAVGGAVGDVARQGLANVLTGEEKSLQDRALQTGGAAVQEGVGQALGLLGTKALGFLGRTPAYDIPKTTSLVEKSEKLGIPLTAAEATGSRELLRKQKILQNTTQADETFEKFYTGRNEKVGQAVNTILDQISKTPGVRDASGRAVKGAIEAVNKSRAELQQAAKPFYEQSVKPTNIVDLRSMEQPNRQIVEYAINASKKDEDFGPLLRGISPTSMTTLDYAKKYIDDKIKKAMIGGENNRVKILTEAKNDLVNKMETQYPEYKVARGIYEDGMPKITDLESGIVGDITKLEANDVLRAPRIIFGSGSSAQDVRAAREAFDKSGNTEAWNDLVRAHLQQTFESIPDSTTGSIVNIGGTYRKMLYGTPQRREIINAALEGNPAAKENLQWMMDVLEASGKAMKGESITAFAQMGQKELAQEAKGLGPKLMETIEIWKTPSRIGQWWADIQTGKYAAKMADMLTDPAGLEKLKELRKLSPGSAGAIVGLSHLLTTQGVEAADDLRESQRRQLQAQPR